MPNPKLVGRAVSGLLIVLLSAGLTTPYILLHPLTTLPAGFLASAARMEPLVRLLVLSLFVGVRCRWPSRVCSGQLCRRAYRGVA